jgi:hypothetical protein
VDDSNEIRDFMVELADEEFKPSTIEAFTDAAAAMRDRGVTGIAELLGSIKSAMKNEYGD